MKELTKLSNTLNENVKEFSGLVTEYSKKIFEDGTAD